MSTPVLPPDLTRPGPHWLRNGYDHEVTADWIVVPHVPDGGYWLLPGHRLAWGSMVAAEGYTYVCPALTPAETAVLHGTITELQNTVAEHAVKIADLRAERETVRARIRELTDRADGTEPNAREWAPL